MRDLMHRNDIMCKVNDISGNLTLGLSKKTKSTSGHIHFYFRNKSDHIVIVWSNGLLKRIVAKSPHCKKGQCVKWEYSQFCDYKREEVIEKLCEEIEYAQIDRDGFNKRWSSYGDLIWWLVENGFPLRS